MINYKHLQEVVVPSDSKFKNGRLITDILNTETGEVFKLPYRIKTEDLNKEVQVKELNLFKDGCSGQHHLNFGYNFFISNLVITPECPKGQLEEKLVKGETFTVTFKVEPTLEQMLTVAEDHLLEVYLQPLVDFINLK